MIRLILLRLLESYFRHRWLYTMPFVMLSLAGVLYVNRQPATYIARGTLYAQDKTLLASLTARGTDAYTWSTPAQATVGEMRELLNTKAFLRAIAEQTDLEIKMREGSEAVDDVVDEVQKAVWLQELGNNLILVGAAHEMPRVAHQLVSSTVDTFIQWKININREDSVAAQKFFADLIETYRKQVDPAREAFAMYLSEHPKPVRGERSDEEVAAMARLQTAIDIAEERLHRAENQEESARLALVQSESDVHQSYFLVDAPERPTQPEHSKKDLVLSLAMFAFAGLFISVVGVVGAALLDSSFRFAADVQYGLNIPLLATVSDSTFTLAPLPQPVQQAREAAHAQTNGKVETEITNGNSDREIGLGTEAIPHANPTNGLATEAMITEPPSNGIAPPLAATDQGSVLPANGLRRRKRYFG